MDEYYAYKNERKTTRNGAARVRQGPTEDNEAMAMPPHAVEVGRSWGRSRGKGETRGKGEASRCHRSKLSSKNQFLYLACVINAYSRTIIYSCFWRIQPRVGAPTKPWSTRSPSAHVCGDRRAGKAMSFGATHF